jgi:acetyl esterase/lipase
MNRIAKRLVLLTIVNHIIPNAAFADWLIDGALIPGDARVVPPSAAVPASQQRFLGAWVGRWRDAVKHILIVESVQPDGSANVIYAYGVYPGLSIRSGFRRLRAKISGDALTIEDSFTATYKLTSANSATASYERGASRYQADMVKVDLAALIASGAEFASDQYSQPIEPTFYDIPYATLSRLQKLDLYLPAAKDRPAPLVIWIHGGAFRVGDKRSMPRRDFGPAPTPIGPDGPYQIQVPDVAALTRKGYAVVSLNYRLLRRTGDSFIDYALPAVQDGKAAVRFLRANAANYGLNPDKFAVWGNSAGGFIAAMLALTGQQPTVFDDPALGNSDISSAVQAAVVWYGAIEVDSLSIAHFVSAAKIIPPMLIANGDADTSVPVAQAIRLNDELLKKGAKSTLSIVPGAHHEDPAFMATQMLPTFKFLDATFGR